VLQGGYHGLGLGLGDEPEGTPPASQADAAQFDLCRGLFAGHEQRGDAPRFHGEQGLEQKSALPHAGLAAHQDYRPGHQPAAEDPVQLTQSGVCAITVLEADVGQNDCRRDRHSGPGVPVTLTRRPRSCRGGYHFLYGVPLPTARTASEPARRLVAALPADEGPFAAPRHSPLQLLGL
jgi:hypothetical protein